jgi:exopolyphosphatase / guanosine-5'-triphosphate,3'-diphosphate pyrophosphatase
VLVAVVDIGTNSTRLLIARMDDGRVVEEVERCSVVTRLGRGVDADGRLSEEGIQRVCDTLDDYRERMDRARVSSGVAVLTSAVRDAANGPEFADAVGKRYGLEPRVLSGEDEARLTFLGATSERAGGEPTVVIDIGGGSTECVIGTPGSEPDFHVSNQAGVVRQTERHIHSDPPQRAELDALAGDVRAIILAGVPEQWRRAVQHGIAVAGTATSLAGIAQALDPYDPEKAHGYMLSRGEAQDILGRLAAMTLAERREVKGLDPNRAPTIVAGVVIMLEALALFGLEEIEVSEHDILRGAAISFAGHF